MGCLSGFGGSCKRLHKAIQRPLGGYLWAAIRIGKIQPINEPHGDDGEDDNGGDGEADDDDDDDYDAEGFHGDDNKMRLG